MSNIDTTQTLPTYDFRKAGRHARPSNHTHVRLFKKFKQLLVTDPVPYTEVSDTVSYEPWMHKVDGILNLADSIRRYTFGSSLRMPACVAGMAAALILGTALFSAFFAVPYSALKLESSVEALAGYAVAGLAVLVFMTWVASQIRRKPRRAEGRLAGHSRRLLIAFDDELLYGED